MAVTAVIEWPIELGVVLYEDTNNQVWDHVAETLVNVPAGPGLWSSELLAPTVRAGGMGLWRVSIPSALENLNWRACGYANVAPAIGDAIVAAAVNNSGLDGTGGVPAFPDAVLIFARRADGEVMGRHTVLKTTSEILTLAFAFDDLLADNESIDSIESVTVESGENFETGTPEVPPQLTPQGSPILDGSRVLQQYTGGTDLHEYRIRVAVKTNAAPTNEYAPSFLVAVKNE